jgi:hypothetical protein
MARAESGTRSGRGGISNPLEVIEQIQGEL